jgi:hypothetical protein
MSKLVVSQIEDAGGSSLLGRRNAIINGNFGINQRGVSGTVTLAAGAYGHDRWKAGASGCTYTFATSENVTTITISAGSLIQVVEGLNLLSGTHVLSWTGTAQGKIGAGSFDSSGVTGSVTGGTNLNIEFGTGTLSKVQLEAGDTATPFEHRSYGAELALCQRYYERGFTDSIGTVANVTSQGQIPISFKVAKRASPTMSVIPSVSLSSSVAEVGTAFRTPTGFSFGSSNINSTNSITSGTTYGATFRPIILLTDCIQASAEL